MRVFLNAITMPKPKSWEGTLVYWQLALYLKKAIAKIAFLGISMSFNIINGS